MIDAIPSRTAMAVAVRRAAHQVFDTPKVLDDPLALPIVGPDAGAQLQAAEGEQQSELSRAVRAFMVARSRVAEDELARAIARGTPQYVILGAGLDTFAYRNPYPAAALRVFEVDHPATQEWKRRKLAAAAIETPSSLTFAAVDFERQTLADGLAAAGFNRDAPAFFSWLGVTMYLSEQAIAPVLAFVASTPAGGGIVFDYAVAKSSLGWVSRMAMAALSKRVAKAGEPFQTFFDPVTLQQRLTKLGFRALEDLGSDELTARYFAGREDGLRVSGNLGRVISAEH